MVTPNDPNRGVFWLLDQPEVKTLVDPGQYDLNRWPFQLTMKGWERNAAIKRAQVESRRVLMAMKFNDDELNRVVDEYFRPAVARAGFELRLLTDG